MRFKERKEIVLSLQNRGSASANFNLFQYSANGSVAYIQSVGINTSDFAGASNWSITYIPLGGASTNYTITDPTGIDDLITKLNAQFGSGTFWYESDPVFTYSLKAGNVQYSFVRITPTPKPFRNFSTSTTQTVLSGTSVQVTVGYAGVTYNAICTDLSSQPYILTSMYLYSSNINQIDNEITISLLDPNGVARVRPVQPIIDPNQSQNVQGAIPLYMRPSALNNMSFTIEANTTVKAVIRYENIGLFNALELLESGEFMVEMEKLRQIDAIEYKRIMEYLKGFDVIEEIDGIKPWSKEEATSNGVELKSGAIIDLPKDYQQPPLAVPLIYSVAKSNGNHFVRIW